MLTRNRLLTSVAICTITSCCMSLYLIQQTLWVKNGTSILLSQKDELQQVPLQELSIVTLRRATRKHGEDNTEIRHRQNHVMQELEDDKNSKKIAKLEAKAIRLLYSSNHSREGLLHAVPPEIHYAFTTFQLSLGQSTSFAYSLTNYQNDTLVWKEDTSSYKGRVVCEMNKLHSLNMNHIPHFAQVAFPCWSVLHQFSTTKRYIQLNQFELKDLTSKWIIDLLQTFQDAGISILVDHDGNSKDGPHQNIEEQTGWRISINRKSSGGFPRKLEDSKYSIENTKYFLNSHSDVEALQRQVLGKDCVRDHQRRHRIPLRALLIDRAGTTREWIYSNETASKIQQVWGEDIHLKVVSNFNGALNEQAMEIHNADIIISPHGAQLTNLAFIYPCTAVLELFPRGYYLGYFQPLVLSAGGIALDGYPWDRNPLEDTAAELIGDFKTRKWLRKSHIHASPDSILRVLPSVISQIISCRRGGNDPVL